MRLQAPNDFGLSRLDLPADTTVLILVNPNNPSGGPSQRSSQK
jgi:histidinol-phosphate/aromatic aminotransferase/cobyric acid decarboxylase-like protein